MNVESSKADRRKEFFGLSLFQALLGLVALNPTFYEVRQVLFFIFFELAFPLDKPHLLLMSTQDPIYPFMP